MTSPTIPIRNLYYLYCYAWNRFEEAQTIAVEAEQGPDLPTLLVRVLMAGTRSLLGRGLDRTYLPFREELNTVRGHIELGPTIRLKMRKTRRVDCSFDELTHDVLHNQLLKATLKKLCRTSALAPNLLSDLKHLWMRMADVSDIQLTSAAFARVQLHRNNARYDFLLKICSLLFHDLIPLKAQGDYAFHDIVRDERKMAGVFERFVLAFYQTKLSRFRASARWLNWQATELASSHSARIPGMKTDVYLESIDRRLIIDTKFYRDPLQEHHDNTSYRSGHLFQLFAYLRNDAMTRLHAPVAEGMLLYAEVEDSLDSSYSIHGHIVRIASVNLAQPWQQIEERLLHLVAA